MSRHPVSGQVLKAHRSNLAAAQTFEEFKERQLQFLDYLVAVDEAEAAQREAAITFLGKSVDYAIETIVMTDHPAMEQGQP